MGSKKRKRGSKENGTELDGDDDDDGDNLKKKKQASVEEDIDEEQDAAINEDGSDNDNNDDAQDDNNNDEIDPKDKNKPCKNNPQGVTRLFLGNLPFAVSEPTLSTHLKDCLTHVKWITDKEKGNW